MSATRASPPVSPLDRLGLALFFAAVAHALVILGVSFAPVDRDRQPADLPTLDVTLVSKPSRKAPEDADYLAQANQQGRGNVPEKVRPRTPPRGGVEAPAPPAPDAALHSPPQTERTQVVSRPGRRAGSAQAAPVRAPASQPLSAAQLISRSLEIASLDAELQESLQAYAKRPRQKFISARTREYKYASYMEAWVAKVERVGNLNYPDEARRRRLSGSLLLDVALNPDGTIHNITLLRPSGYKVLDDAAIRIVRLAAPFAPFPDEMRKEIDVLHITRTWEFLSSNRLSSR